MAGNPWDGDPISQPKAGGLFQLPKTPDPDAAISHQMKVLQLQKAMKDATKEQADDGTIDALAKLYVSNKLVPPTRPNEVAQKAIARAMQMDPNYDPELAGNRAKAIKDFSGNGQASQTVRSINRLANHLNDMWEASEKMGGPNLGLRTVNKIVAGVEQEGEPELVAKYDAAKQGVATELEKFMKGTGEPNVAGIQASLQSLGRARSLDERRAAFKQISSLVHGGLEPIRQSWNSAYGGNYAPPMWVSPQAAQVFGKIDPDNASTFGGDDWRGLPGLKGVGNQPTLPPGGTPPGAGTPPPAGTPLTPASGPTKTVITQSDTDKKIAAMLAGGVPGAQIKKFVADSGQDYGGKLNSILAWRAVNPKYRGGYDVHGEKIVPTTLANRMAASPAAAAGAGMADAATAGLLDEGVGAINTIKDGGSLSDNIAAADLAKQTLAGENPGATLAGNVAGGATAMIGGGLGLKALLEGGAQGGAGRKLLAWALKNPIKSAALGDAGYGAAYGAGENNDNRLLGAAVGAPVGAAGSFVGAGASKALGATLQGVVDPAVQRLRAAGIPLTVGEVLGGGAKKAQDSLTSVFGPGNMVARRYNDGRRALNQAFFNEAGNEVGTPINAVGQKGVQALDAAKSQAYSNSLDPVSLNLNTPDFIDPMKGIKAGAAEIPAADLPEGYANTTIDRYVGNNIRPDGTMSGADFQKAYRGLAQTANKVSPKVEGHDISQTLSQAKDVLSSTLADQNPQAYQGFLAANRANRMLNIIATAQRAAKNQISDGGEALATPAQFGTAATDNAAKYSGNIAAATGNRPFNQLINDSQQVMSSKLPDSGTATRLLMTKLAATGGLAGIGGLGGFTADGEEGAAAGGLGTLGLLTALGTKKGQQLLTAALLKRTIADQLVGRSVSRNPQFGAGILASAGVPLLDSPTR